MTTDRQKLTALRPQRRNANKHTPRGMGALERSIQEDGWIGAITVAADGETFDGSARIEVGAAAGFEDVIVVESDGSKPVVVKRVDIPTTDDPRAIRLGVAANRVAQVDLAWDASVLAELAEEQDLSGLFFPHEMAALLEQAGTEILDANDLWRGMPEFEQEDVADNKITIYFADDHGRAQLSSVLGQPVTPETKFIWFPPGARPVRQDAALIRVEHES